MIFIYVNIHVQIVSADCNKNVVPQNTYVMPVNPLSPNDHYRGRTEPLTSNVALYIYIYIQQI